MNTKKYIPTWAENATHYHCGPPSDTTEYRGYTITAIYDESPMNPFDDWDTEPPLYVAGTDKIKEVINRNTDIYISNGYGYINCSYDFVAVDFDKIDMEDIQ